MKNQFPVLTNKEKINFLVKLQNLQKYGWPKPKSTALVFKSLCFGLSAIFATLFTASFFAPNLAYIAIFAGVFSSSFWFSYFLANNRENQMLLKISNNKINRKEFYKLVKSGEIQKWQEMFKEQVENIRLEKLNIEVNDYISEGVKDFITSTLERNQNAKLDAEKLANSIKNIAKSNEQKQTTTPSQNGYIHECPAVKKMFELVEDDENIDTSMNKISFDAYEK